MTQPIIVTNEDRQPPLPLAGRGKRWGSWCASLSQKKCTTTPTPDPSPQGGGRASVTIIALALLVPLPAFAENTTRVLELFTSQGCPKCPPADQLVTDFAKEPGTIALSFAVNYWDYIGWKDTLASPAFTARQHAYAAARGDRRIFTPQAIVDGRGVEPGADKEAILRDMRKGPQDGALSVPIAITQAQGKVRIHVGEGTGAGGVYVLRVARSKTVQIGRGENSGQSVTYTNAVRAMSKLGDWTGAPLDLDMVELKGDDEGYVVLLQAGSPEKPGTILAAAKSADL